MRTLTLLSIGVWMVATATLQAETKNTNFNEEKPGFITNPPVEYREILPFPDINEQVVTFDQFHERFEVFFTVYEEKLDKVTREFLNARKGLVIHLEEAVRKSAWYKNWEEGGPASWELWKKVALLPHCDDLRHEIERSAPQFGGLCSLPEFNEYTKDEREGISLYIDLVTDIQEEFTSKRSWAFERYLENKNQKLAGGSGDIKTP